MKRITGNSNRSSIHFGSSQNLKYPVVNNQIPKKEDKLSEGRGCMNLVRDTAFGGLGIVAAVKLIAFPPAWLALPVISNFSSQIIFAKKRMLQESVSRYSKTSDAERNTMLRNSLLQNAVGELLSQAKDYHGK